MEYRIRANPAPAAPNRRQGRKTVGFWDVFIMLLIWIPLVLIWATALIDIFRRDDIGAVSKAIWFAVVILLPFVGTLFYLIFRRPEPRRGSARPSTRSSRPRRPGSSAPAPDEVMA